MDMKVTLAFFAGLIINVALVCYVYFFVEGGPVALQQGGDWMAVLNEVPQTVLITIAGILLPYYMVWNKLRRNPSRLKTASQVMLAVTISAAAVIVFAHAAMIREVAMDISWVILWFTAVYFMMAPDRD